MSDRPPSSRRRQRARPQLGLLADATPTQLREAIVAAYADLRARTSAEVEAQMASSGGQLEFDSPEGVAILTALETRFSCTLPDTKQITRRDCTSLHGLLELIERTRRQAPTHDGDAS